MSCPSCGATLAPNERYCRNCGYDTFSPADTMGAPAPTAPYRPAPTTGAPAGVDPNARTEYLPASAMPTAEIGRPLSTADVKRRSPLVIPLVVLGVLLILAIAGTLAYLFWPAHTDKSAGGALPDHFGVFIRSGDQLNELRRRDFSNAIEARDALTADSSLPEAEARPTLILYAEAQDIPVSDLKLVQLDSINQSGQVRYWSFQVAPVEGRSGMKQMRVASGLPTGKYAFALFQGYLNEGNHKFWPFEVKEGLSEPQEKAQTATIPVKANPQPTPATANANAQPSPKASPDNQPPPGAKLGYCNDTNVFVRSSPDLNARPVAKITKGQKLWAIGKSTNTSTWNGTTSDWTQVQLYNSATRGWVFSPFISY